MYNLVYLTLFPEIFQTYFKNSIPQKSLQKQCFNYQIYNIRDWAVHGKVDDYLYGGGRGMLLKIDCLVRTLASVYEKYGKDCYVILLSPKGKTFTQQKITKIIKNRTIVFICDSYEGSDWRITKYVDEILSIGKFICTSGGLPALVVTDALIRFLPGVLDSEVYQEETFSRKGYIEPPAYTRPRIFDGLEVPSVLLEGNHFKIRKFCENFNFDEKMRKLNKKIPHANQWRLSLIDKNK